MVLFPDFLTPRLPNSTMADTSDIRREVFMMYNGAICVLADFQHVNPGKGSAFVSTKLKNVQTGKTIEHTFKVGEKIEVVDLDRTNMQYTYKDPSTYYFMDNTSYEQVGMSIELVGDKGQYLKEGQEVIVLQHDGNPLSIDIPKKLTFKVTESMPGVKGDTTSGRVMKEATLETGMVVQVPLFVKEGDLVVINTENGEYVERA